MRLRPLFLAAALLALAACGDDDPTAASHRPGRQSDQHQASLGQAFTLAVGEAEQAGGVTVTFLGVAQDSRCPSDAMCVWAGDAAVGVRLAAAGEAALETTLHTNPATPGAARSASYHGLTLTLQEVAPTPLAGVPIDAALYRATFVAK